MKDWLGREKYLWASLRFILLYCFSMFVAKYPAIYDKGMVPGNLFIAVVAGFLIMYRFLAVAFVPALLVLWVFKIIEKKKK